MNLLRRLMVGRYGQDQLSIFLFVISIILTLVGQFSKISIFMILSYIPMFIAISRMLSKDVYKRRMENYKFSKLFNPIYSKVRKIQSRIVGSKTHVYFKCTKCSTSLRMPKNKGKVLVTCPTCKEKFTKRT